VPSSIGKRNREQAKKAKADAKRQRKEGQTGAPAEDEVDAESAPAATTPEATENVLEMLAALHQQFDDGAVSFEDFETRKAELLARLVVE